MTAVLMCLPTATQDTPLTPSTRHPCEKCGTEVWVADDRRKKLPAVGPDGTPVFMEVPTELLLLCPWCCVDAALADEDSEPGQVMMLTMMAHATQGERPGEGN